MIIPRIVPYICYLYLRSCICYQANIYHVELYNKEFMTICNGNAFKRYIYGIKEMI